MLTAEWLISGSFWRYPNSTTQQSSPWRNLSKLSSTAKSKTTLFKGRRWAYQGIIWMRLGTILEEIPPAFMERRGTCPDILTPQFTFPLGICHLRDNLLKRPQTWWLNIPQHLPFPQVSKCTFCHRCSVCLHYRGSNMSSENQTPCKSPHIRGVLKKLMKN